MDSQGHVRNAHHHDFLSIATHSTLVFGRAMCREECQVACEGHPLVLNRPLCIYRGDIRHLRSSRDEYESGGQRLRLCGG